MNAATSTSSTRSTSRIDGFFRRALAMTGDTVREWSAIAEGSWTRGIRDGAGYYDD